MSRLSLRMPGISQGGTTITMRGFVSTAIRDVSSFRAAGRFRVREGGRRGRTTGFLGHQRVTTVKGGTRSQAHGVTSSHFTLHPDALHQFTQTVLLHGFILEPLDSMATTV